MGQVRAGQAFVELLLDSRHFTAGLSRSMRSVKHFAGDAARIGRDLGLLGLGLASGFLAMAQSTVGVPKELTRAFGTLKATITGALMPALSPLLTKVEAVMGSMAAWAAMNPELAQSMFAISGAVAVLGGSIYVISKALALMVTPASLAILGIVGVGAAFFAVTDSLGKTDTGFLQLFNSIRIGGSGIGTHLAEIFATMSARFRQTMLIMADAWDGFKLKGLDVTADFAATWDILMEGMADGWNDLFGDELGRVTLQRSPKLQEAQAEVARLKSRPNVRHELNAIDAELNIAIEKMRKADERPGDAGKGLSFDTEAAKEALKKIGANILEVVGGVLDDLGPDVIGAGDPTASAVSSRFTSAATFSGTAAEHLGIGFSLAERTAKATERTAKNTEALAAQVEYDWYTFG